MMATTPAAELAGEVRGLARLVDEAQDRDDAETLARLADGLVPVVLALPARAEVAKEARSRAVSGLKTARIHLARAGADVDLTRGLLLASAALARTVEDVEVLTRQGEQLTG